LPDADAHVAQPEHLTRDGTLLADTVREAGALGLKLFRTELRMWTKGESSPVSEADIAVNDLIQKRLRAVTPDYGWLSEESADDASRLGKHLTWIIDPIDGTRGYLAGRTDWCISAALVAGHRPVLAAVFAPATDEFLLAERGRGATCNGVPIRATDGVALDFQRIAGPKPLVQRLIDPSEEISLYPRISSLALRLCWVANGKLDAAFAGGQSRDWDIAAADLIVHEANGRMTGLSGDPVLYNRKEVTHGLLVAAGADRHAQIIAHLESRPRA
jgi:myo-inositol-1(or 4)-monophosphatase